MDERQKVLCAQLVKMGSEQAAEWLINRYPVDSIDYGEALLLIPHRSWRRSDQKRLAQHYFRKLPFSGAGGYEAFASFMSVKTFLDCVRERLPMSASDASLLLYYLTPVLNKFAKNESDRQLIMNFLNEVRPS
ncbi:TPA: hypothetical protein L4S95_004211 [Pseudomonas aeruginosa]|jgi:hypothetical protein|uniref:hypothetical protein n=1 Tax=Pseudomonas TaxID=286 RepID=UPI0008FB12BA|nr:MULTISPECIES: hypothetical protein [Pseudomonas]EKU8866022.1 hypothetical protein [Pseudomonas aeruginosa]EKW7738456.1 hypothetical protein [Pseudomonas aeruginosa]EKW9640361.1 hypothetical protein [Pseudomonas aeruginosa]EKX2957725.1 hypothetical protein [Pseudomonas aeruginosa]EKX3429944.1 hypothetical protein [Pseudomonas aeruginosa]